ncbi:MAG TPA: hypothetical protein VJA46_09905 [Acidimicrobiia bacterium]|nr:hypothetical protein [Acidimicrobiia bacterium]
MRATKTIAVLVAAVGLPLAFLVWARLEADDRLAVLEAPVEPVSAVAVRQVVDDAKPAIAQVIFDDAPSLTVNDVTGLVTAVPVVAENVIDDGDTVLEVDRVPRIGYLGPAPFHRSLVVGDVGADVALLAEVLVRWGLMSLHEGATYDQAVRSGVAALAARVGVSSDGRVFDRSWLVWIGPDPFPVSTLPALVGDRVTDGFVVATGLAPVKSVTVVEASGSPLMAPGEWVFEADGVSTVLSDGVVAEDDLAQFGSAPVDGLAGTVHRSTAREVSMIAATAVQVGTEGEACVWVDEGGAFRPVEVEVSGGRASLSEVTGLVDGAVVLVNPAAVLDDPACP